MRLILGYTIAAMQDRPPARTIRFGAVTFVPDERLLLKDGHPATLTPKAFDVLAVLAANPGRLVTKEQLIEAVWPGTVVEESNLTYHIFAIRKALGEAPDGERYIETVPRKGYRLVAALATEPSAPIGAGAAARSRRPMLALAAVLALAVVAYLGVSQRTKRAGRARSDAFPGCRVRAPRRLRDVRGVAGWPAACLCRRRHRWRDAPVAADDERARAGSAAGHRGLHDCPADDLVSR